MEYIQHPLATSTIGPPSDMPDTCGTLHVKTWADTDGPWVTSFWKPSEAELAALNDGGCVGLNLRTVPRQHPVTFMVVYTKEAGQPTDPGEIKS